MLSEVGENIRTYESNYQDHINWKNDVNKKFGLGN